MPRKYDGVEHMERAADDAELLGSSGTSQGKRQWPADPSTTVFALQDGLAA
jgi:hypothetical protein